MLYFSIWSSSTWLSGMIESIRFVYNMVVGRVLKGVNPSGKELLETNKRYLCWFLVWYICKIYWSMWKINIHVLKLTTHKICTRCVNYNINNNTNGPDINPHWPHQIYLPGIVGLWCVCVWGGCTIDTIITEKPLSIQTQTNTSPYPYWRIPWNDVRNY